MYVTGQPLTSGGVLLDITDNGVGISEQEMAHANWRLDNPPVVDVAVSRRMGLFVVGRLAARHGVRVRLRHAQSGGLTALIWLPESVAAPESAQPLGRLRKFEADDFGPAPSLSAPTRPSARCRLRRPRRPVRAAGRPARPRRPRRSRARRIRLRGRGRRGGGPDTQVLRRRRQRPRRQRRHRRRSAPSAASATGRAPALTAAPASSAPSLAGPVTAPAAALPRAMAARPARSTRPAPAAYPAASGGGGPVLRQRRRRLRGGPDFGTTRMPALGGDGGSAALHGCRAPHGGQRPRRLRRQPGHDSGVCRPGTGPATADLRLARVGLVPAQRQVAELDGGLGRAHRAGARRRTRGSGPRAWRHRPRREKPRRPGCQSACRGLTSCPDRSVAARRRRRVAPPARSAETIRSRMASFQRGVRDARAAAPQNEEP